MIRSIATIGLFACSACENNEEAASPAEQDHKTISPGETTPPQFRTEQTPSPPTLEGRRGTGVTFFPATYPLPSPELLPLTKKIHEHIVTIGDYPVVSITHHAASKFCEWLSAQTGQFYRLATEAEWEYAARAGTRSAYSFGENPDDLGAHAWHLDNSDDVYHPVGEKKPNAWGLFDMHGNVSEWVLDGGDPDFRARLHEGTPNPWLIPQTRYPRIVMGGSWRDPAPLLRCAARKESSKRWIMMDPQLPRSLWYLTNDDTLAPLGNPVGIRIIRPLKVPPAEEMHLYWNTDWWSMKRSLEEEN